MTEWAPTKKELKQALDREAKLILREIDSAREVCKRRQLRHYLRTGEVKQEPCEILFRTRFECGSYIYPAYTIERLKDQADFKVEPYTDPDRKGCRGFKVTITKL